MEPFLRGAFANASTQYTRGRKAREAVEDARVEVGRLIGAAPTEIFFTSGGTEANNLALRGVMEAEPGAGHLVITSLEHASVLRCAAALEEAGHSITRVPPAATGAMEAVQILGANSPRPRLVSVMLANNETGVVQPVSSVGSACAEDGVPLHCDAVQAIGRLPVDVTTLQVDLLTMSAHKLHGPQGIGALYVRDGTLLRPLFGGGAQEGGVRPGTQNVPGIVGFGEAARLARIELETRMAYVDNLRQRLEEGLWRSAADAVVVGSKVPRLPNTSLVCYPNRDGEALAANLDQGGFAVATGAACDGEDGGPSHVLQSMGLAPNIVSGALRFSLGPDNTSEEVDSLVRAVSKLIGKSAWYRRS